jgi:molybdate transport system ATP-binding protein
MSLAVDITLDRPGFRLAASFTSPGGVTALFGPSGAGKTTLGLLVAGLVRPTRGRIDLDGAVLVDTASGSFVAPHRRGIPVVFQDGRLFPHLTVRQNLAYGRWFGGTGSLQPIVDLLDLGPLLARRPATLSGGEARRVAIGRALVSRARLLILDEPLTGLDAARRQEILPYLARLRDTLRIPIILITHGTDEVIRLADTLVLLEHGTAVRAGPVAEILAWLGDDDAGTMIDATVEAVDAEWGLATLAFAGGSLRVPRGHLAAGQAVRLHLRARDVAVATVAPLGTSILNALPARIEAIEPAGETAVDLRLAVGPTRLVARITRLSADTLNLAPGRPVQALIKSVAFARGGDRLS